jgi:uncharacterized membrane protein
MEQVTGIGGVFFKVRDPQRMAAWYQQNLGIQSNDGCADFVWREKDHPNQTGRTVWAIPISAAIAIAVLAIVIRPQDESSTGTASVPFATVQRIVDQRCTACHSLHPKLVAQAPLNLRLDTPQEIQRYAPDVKGMAVDSTAMPLGNVTKMTEQERQLLGRWIDQGAKIP